MQAGPWPECKACNIARCNEFRHDARREGWRMHELATLRQIRIGTVRRWRYVVPRERSAVGTFADAMERT